MDELHGIMLREISQPQRTNSVRLFPCEAPRGVRFRETESRGWLPGAAGREIG